MPNELRQSFALLAGGSNSWIWIAKPVKTPDHEQKLQLDGTEEPDFQKTLDCHGDLRHLCSRSRQRSNLDDECFCGIAIFDFAHVNCGVATLLPVHTARRRPG